MRVGRLFHIMARGLGAYLNVGKCDCVIIIH